MISDILISLLAAAAMGAVGFVISAFGVHIEDMANAYPVQFAVLVALFLLSLVAVFAVCRLANSRRAEALRQSLTDARRDISILNKRLSEQTELSDRAKTVEAILSTGDDEGRDRASV